jgi:hypothetical protein
VRQPTDLETQLRSAARLAWWALITVVVAAGLLLGASRHAARPDPQGPVPSPVPGPAATLR